jgi:S-adenosylmethionine hydrolase
MSHLIHRAIAVVLLLAAVPAFAQQGADVGAKIRETQALVAKEFRQILREEMLLTDAESEAFWPLYERYSAEKRAINEPYFAALIEYVDRYYNGDLNDEHAERLMNTYFEVHQANLRKRQEYVRKFGNVMSKVKVMRFFQLENKVQAEVNAALAATIPLADPR